MKSLRFVLLLAVGVITHGQAYKLGEVPYADSWIPDIEHGISSFHANPADYKVYRNVMDFGCAGDGVTDDTICINLAISSGGRCGMNCGSSTLSPAIVYFPSGQYLISSPIIQYYFTQMVGNAIDRPVLIAAPTFEGIGMIDSDPYLPGGGQWYTNQNNFFRQIRNFVLDTTRSPASSGTTGIHWQVAQATSLVNLHFKMSTEPGNEHQGIWMENGSGGFMADLVFDGGKFGMWVGNQQFLSRNMVFNNCQTAIYMNWNWQWTFKNLKINNCGIGIDMSAPSDTVTSGVGSILLMDSTITDTPTGVLINGSPEPNGDDTSGTLLLDNVKINNVPNVVLDVAGPTLLPGSGSQTIASWGRGSVYNGGTGPVYGYGPRTPPQKSANLLDAQGNFFEQSRPQYENNPVTDFASVKAGGAKGDGVTDDSDAIQAVINQSVNSKIVFFPAGSYVIGKTVTVPSGSRLTGETWSVLMAGGPAFQSETSPQPMLKVGEPGQAGSVEITDLMFSTKGAQPGAILVQWNMRELPGQQGSAAMWDSHFRVGGTTGTNLQVPQCPKGQGYVPQCVGAHTLLHLTTQSSAYLENVWAWVSDHDLDNHLEQGQISIYNGRGVLIESTEGPVWLYGTQSEHNVLYQYQLVGAKNVFMTMIQSETPYWQSGPPAPAPFFPNLVLTDPSYAHCAPGDIRCPMSYAIRAVRSSNIFIYGAGMYNFFNNYDQTCLLTEDCQTSMVNLEGNSNFYMFNGNTKAAINMVVADNTNVLALASDNNNGFCQTINAFFG